MKRILFVLFALMLGFGAVSASPAPASFGYIGGRTLIGPNCGGGPLFKPAQLTLLISKENSGIGVYKTSSVKGSFRVRVEPGTYIIQPVNLPNSYVRVAVSAGKVTKVVVKASNGLSCDDTLAKQVSELATQVATLQSELGELKSADPVITRDEFDKLSQAVAGQLTQQDLADLSDRLDALETNPAVSVEEFDSLTTRVGDLESSTVSLTDFEALKDNLYNETDGWLIVLQERIAQIEDFLGFQ